MNLLFVSSAGRLEFSLHAMEEISFVLSTVMVSLQKVVEADITL